MAITNISNQSMTIYDTNDNLTQRSCMKGALNNKALQRRLGFKLTSIKEITTKSMPYGCALYACAAIHLFLEGQDPALLTKKVKPTSQRTKSSTTF
jgi:hypothetical protein